MPTRSDLNHKEFDSGYLTVVDMNYKLLNKEGENDS